MNKKIFGIKIGTVLTFALCLIISFILWLVIRISGESEIVFGIPYLRFLRGRI